MNKKTHIFLAAGIFYPDVGGPAVHVKNIAERFVQEGFHVTVLAYGDDIHNTEFTFQVKRISRSFPKYIQWILYIFYTVWFSFNAHIVYAFDPTSAGLPACVCAKIFFKPFFIRIGGDPIWERDAEEGRVFLSLDQYYGKGLYKAYPQHILFLLIRSVLNAANVVVLYNENFKNFYTTYYGIDPSKIHIIKNPVFRRRVNSIPPFNDPVILFAGRFVKYKNLDFVIHAFDSVRKITQKGKLVIIGRGPEKESLFALKNRLESGKYIEFLDSLPQHELFKKIESVHIAIGPALSEFNPNFILEALSFGKPVLISRGHGLSVELDDRFVFDPSNMQMLIDKIIYFFDIQNYQGAVSYIQTLPLEQTWDSVTSKHVNLVKKYLEDGV